MLNLTEVLFPISKENDTEHCDYKLWGMETSRKNQNPLRLTCTTDRLEKEVSLVWGQNLTQNGLPHRDWQDNHVGMPSRQLEGWGW